MKKVLFALFISLAALAAQAPDFTLTAEQKGSKLVVTALPPAGHHFNVDAPMSPKPKRAKKDKVVFEVPAGQAIEATLFLCDEKSTYCEKHVVKLGEGAAADKAPMSGPAKPHVDKNGFYVNDPEGAFKAAKSEGKPVIIDFFGIWCPPCNMLDRDVWPTKDFKKAASEWVKLKLDADAEVSWPLKEKYVVSGYPTILFANPEGEEIGRFMGYRPKGVFIQIVKDMWTSRDAAMSKLKELADDGKHPDAAQALGDIYYMRKEFKNAVKYLTMAGKHHENLIDAKIELAEDDVDDQIPVLQQAIREFAEKPNTIDWNMKLAEDYEKKKDEAKRVESLKAAIEAGKKFAAEPKLLAKYDYVLGDIYARIADAYEALKDDAASKKAWTQAAAAYKKSAGSATERGNNLEYAYSLASAGQLKKADAVYRTLERKYPQEFTFYYAHANALLLIAHDPKSAKAPAEQALKYSYGDNRLRAAMLLTKAHKQLGEKEEARKIARTALAEAKLPEDKKIRTHRYYNQLKELEKTLD